VSHLLNNPVFIAAKADIEALGVRMNTESQPDAVPYAIIGGRSNARWWLIPLQNGRVAASALAMFQPTLASARWLKRIAVLCSQLGLTRLWARPSLYISGQPAIASAFARDDLYFAYFTGTDSPHRKAAVQVMDSEGGILGYAKVSRNPAVKELIRHEGAMLGKVKELDLQTAIIPTVLYAGPMADAEVLVTDTLKTNRTRTTLVFTPAHRAFLDELARKTAAGKISAQEMGASYRERFNTVTNRLDDRWRKRLDQAINRLELDAGTQFSLAMAHGDFTPWNTFMVDSKLYVFDWEYALEAAPVGINQVHFDQSVLGPDNAALGTAYHLHQCLRQIERMPADCRDIWDWDGVKNSELYFDRMMKPCAGDRQ
jgi:hypothetical protein